MNDSNKSTKPEPLPRSAPAVLQTRGFLAQKAVNLLAAIGRTSPGAERQLIEGARAIKNALRRTSNRVRRMAAADADAQAPLLITINPADVEYCCETEFSFGFFKGAVKDGNWDQESKRFEDLDIYVAFETVCKNKTATWQETVFYQRFTKAIAAGEAFWNCHTKADFDKRCQGLSELYESIKRNGYKAHSERDPSITAADSMDECSVAISRDGDILFSDGAHRMTIAKLLGLKQIPVTVTVRHSKWANFRLELADLARQQASGLLYQPCLHPDLIDIAAAHSCEDRFDAIRAKLPGSSGKILDIGCNMSYFSQRLEAEGFDCIASENSQLHLYYIRKLKRASRLKFEVRSESVLEDAEVLKHDYEAVLALSIFHHFIKTEKLFNLLTNFLQQLNTKAIFFEPHIPEEIQMENAYRNFTQEEFCDFVAKQAGLSQFRKISTSEHGRNLYIIS